jgi:hypothetical protein
MNKTELKKLLKPLIKECIKEVIFEDGVLSGVVAEVAHGLSKAPLVETRNVTTVSQPEQAARSVAEQKQKLNEHRKKLLDAIGNEAYNGVNLFEGTTPMASGGTAPGAQTTAQGPLTGVAPTDPGVDISGLIGTVGRNWKAHLDIGK